MSEDPRLEAIAAVLVQLDHVDDWSRGFGAELSELDDWEQGSARGAAQSIIDAVDAL